LIDFKIKLFARLVLKLNSLFVGFVFFTVGFIPQPSFAQIPNKTRILFLFDASFSMQGKMGKEIKMDLAKSLLSKMIDSLRSKPDLEIALRVFGHTTHKDRKNCKDTKLEVPFRNNNYDAIQANLKGLKPLGTTMIAYSLQEATYDFPKDKLSRNVIILITDGIEECHGDPCAVSDALQRNGVILKPFIIGIGMDIKSAKLYECVGRFFDANSKDGFDNVLRIVISQALQNTTLQMNLLDESSKATETDVDMTFYDNHTGRMENNYVQTINVQGVPDTIIMDPVNHYNVVVHTLPPVKKDNIEIVAGRHNIVPIDAPQGSLKLVAGGMVTYTRLQCIIKKAGTYETVNVQDFNTTEKYITGLYDLEILSTPRYSQINIAISQSKVSEIAIPPPGKLNFYSRYAVIGAIYRMNNNQLEWVINLNSNIIGLQSIILQPGNYKIISRINSEKRVVATKKSDFEIRSGQTLPLSL